MKLLLDTHAFIWWDTDPARLPPEVIEACTSEDNTVHLSVASAWEIQIKSQLGKLQLRLPLAEIIAAQEQSNQIEVLPVFLAHVLALQHLPHHHSDPFDRLLIAQAIAEDATLISHDSRFSDYEVRLLW